VESYFERDFNNDNDDFVSFLPCFIYGVNLRGCGVGLFDFM